MTSTQESSDRAGRAARNESLFREVNERVKEINEGMGSPRLLDEWLCECANATCTERIQLTIEEYECVRNEPTHFAVAAEHVLPDERIERVVERTDRYWVAEKTGDAAAVAEQLDPRSEGRAAGD